jgi:hypothetical protein
VVQPAPGWAGAESGQPAAAPAWASPEPEPAAPAPEAASDGALEILAAVQQQTAQLRRWLVGGVMLNTLLAIVLLYQIQRTQHKITQLRQQAQNAVQYLQPQLNRRLNRFSSQIAQADVKMKADMQQSEDQFMQKLRRELPRKMDQYQQAKERQLHITQP